MNDEEKEFPCEDCITFSICKSLAQKPNASLYTLMSRCDLIKEYILSESLNISFNNYGELIKIFDVKSLDPYFKY